MGGLLSQPKTRWCVHTNLTSEAELKRLLQEHAIPYEGIINLRTSPLIFYGSYSEEELEKIRNLGLQQEKRDHTWELETEDEAKIP